MKATGIVVEHNPFHNGHFYHIKESRNKTAADIIIAVMSGNFLQRGEPSLVDKWTRSEMALKAGVDLVIELPYVFATAQASDFARGSIALLEALGCDAFCFGSEEGTIEPFTNTYEVITSQQQTYQKLIKQYMKLGFSYPKSLNQSYAEITKDNNLRLVDLSKPNNILGYHYVEAANQINARMKPFTIQRIIANYHDEVDESQSIASATGIRKAIFEEGSIDALANFMPQTSLDLLLKWKESVGVFGSWPQFWPRLRFTIIRSSLKELASYAEVTEGIENLIYEAAIKSETFEEFMTHVKSKRYTWTRIQRMLTHIYTGFTWDALKSHPNPTYLRVLGMTHEGQKYLNQKKKSLSLPLVSRAAATKDSLLDLDIRATDLYQLGLQSSKIERPIGLDFRKTPIII
ncbi:nucleotidyltransferase [Paenisporosarcina sp. OV554]|uniref:nucleotidyltransferase n=1 Tax=Paenisporosarcina sp. OV554 TaxID=2135694 RepID=UPI000D3A7645|nr:nucleotidyltransferase [Paenisporosarcina sp. OV554]PUB18074.1 putative nucleotidyltransferase [Paenisporosarcina sp. OV554]